MPLIGTNTGRALSLFPRLHVHACGCIQHTHVYIINVSLKFFTVCLLTINLFVIRQLRPKAFPFFPISILYFLVRHRQLVSAQQQKSVKIPKSIQFMKERKREALDKEANTLRLGRGVKS